MPSEEPLRRLEDIVENARAILLYTDGMDLGSFEEDRKTYDAVERCLERISEAAAKLGEEAVAMVPGQPWNKIRAMGNRLRHEYDAIREDSMGYRPGRSSGALRRLRGGVGSVLGSAHGAARDLRLTGAIRSAGMRARRRLPAFSNRRAGGILLRPPSQGPS